MIKESKIVDFYTSGRKLTNEDFAKISQWIAKEKLSTRKRKVRKTTVKELA
jgi:hypothetical protein